MKALDKRLNKLESEMKPDANDIQAIRIKFLHGKSLTSDEVGVLEADKELSDRVDRLLADIDKAEMLYQKQIEDLKTIYEPEQVDDEPIGKKADIKIYKGNTNPLMSIEDLPDFLRPVDHSQGVETF